MTDQHKNHQPVALPDLTPLPRTFYEGPSVDIARSLLGKVILARARTEFDWDNPRAEVTGGRIVETEAYGENDPASHASRGQTLRTAVMFGDAGVAYVYFIYGMYEMLNFVTEPRGKAGAVLVRALEPLYGLPLMSRRRPVKRGFEVANGPARLCRALAIKLEDNKQPLTGPRFLVIDDGHHPASLSRSPRVGIRVATDALWRFFVTSSPFVSRVPQNALAEEL